MRLTELIAEHLYLEAHPEIGALMRFKLAESNERDKYFRQARLELPSCIGSYYSNDGMMAKLIRGSILSFIAAHGDIILNKSNMGSLSKRIIGDLKGWFKISKDE